ncbi:hypothetical protein HXX76_012299 [Chlamydomonas incerta]|uniref:Uncharacterized protein n=1 Tax=Chlamydomonas incerta TaxID=51695 RepID=A0A835VW37_CHLIN|nr:hypothetical protein HXX76_012299 [Chlamydomonas incerta]|eukprot:KAG2427649.1 hypothetical protein HXX76_012299 [Chlamydomonas incerta]
MATRSGDPAVVNALERLRLEQQETNRILRQVLHPVQLISSCCEVMVEHVQELAATSMRLAAGLQECVSSLASIRRYAAAISELLAAQSAAAARNGAMAAHAAAARHGLLLSAASCLVAAAVLGLPAQWRACALAGSTRLAWAPAMALEWAWLGAWRGPWAVFPCSAATAARPAAAAATAAGTPPAGASAVARLAGRLQPLLAPGLAPSGPPVAALGSTASPVAWAGPWLGWLGLSGIAQPAAGARGLGSLVACRAQVTGGHLGGLLLLAAWLAATALLLRPRERPSPGGAALCGARMVPPPGDDAASTARPGAGAHAQCTASALRAPAQQLLQPLPAACVTDMWLQSAALLLLPLAAAGHLGTSGMGSSGGYAGANGGWLLRLQLPVFLAALWLMRGASPLAALLLTATWHAALPLAVLTRLRMPVQMRARASLPASAAAAAQEPAAAADAAPAAALGGILDGAGGRHAKGEVLHSPGLQQRRRHAVAIFADGSGSDACQHQHLLHHHSHSPPPPPPAGWLLQAASSTAAGAQRPAASPDPGVVCRSASTPLAGHASHAGVGHPADAAGAGSPSPHGWAWLQSDSVKVLVAGAWLWLGPVLVGAAPVLPPGWWLGVMGRAAAWAVARAVLLAAAGLGVAAVLWVSAGAHRKARQCNPQPNGGGGFGSASAADADGAVAAASAGAQADAGAGRLGTATGRSAQLLPGSPVLSPMASPPPCHGMRYAYPQRPPASEAASPAALATAAALAAAREAAAAGSLSPLASPQLQAPCRRDGAWAPVSAPCTPTRPPGRAAPGQGGIVDRLLQH